MAYRGWRLYPNRDGSFIEGEVRLGRAPSCPRCGEVLEADPNSRARASLVLDARAYDVLCRPCRRFWSIVIQTPRSLRLIRMRRLVAAVRAVDGGEGDRLEGGGRGVPIPQGYSSR